MLFHVVFQRADDRFGFLGKAVGSLLGERLKDIGDGNDPGGDVQICFGQVK